MFTIPVPVHLLLHRRRSAYRLTTFLSCSEYSRLAHRTNSLSLVPFPAGSLSLCSASEGWVSPAPKAGKKDKKKKGGGGEAATAAAAPPKAEQDDDLDPEKAAKKVNHSTTAEGASLLPQCNLHCNSNLHPVLGSWHPHVFACAELLSMRLIPSPPLAVLRLPSWPRRRRKMPSLQPSRHPLLLPSWPRPRRALRATTRRLP